MARTLQTVARLVLCLIVLVAMPLDRDAGAQTPAIMVPETVDPGAVVTVSVTRQVDGSLELDGPVSADGMGQTMTVAQVSGGAARFSAPTQAGTYRLRHVSVSGTTLASVLVDVSAVPVSLSIDTTYGFGAEIVVRWRGPAAPGDRLVVVETATGNELASVEALGIPGDLTATRLDAPSAHGPAELRYVMADGTILQRMPFTVNPPLN